MKPITCSNYALKKAIFLIAKEPKKSTKRLRDETWIDITNKFNFNSETGKQRKMEELKIKYKNMKQKRKKELATHRQVSLETGGGPSFYNFGLAPEEYCGIVNPFDSDGNLLAPEIISIPDNYVVSLNSFDFACFCNFYIIKTISARRRSSKSGS